MQIPWRAAAIAVALHATAAAGMAGAQTVIVRNAPPAAAIDVVVNAATVSSGAADPSGVATLPAKMKETIGKTEIDANVFVDVCETRRRVLIVEVGGAMAELEAGCERRQISGLYWVRPVNTIVVNLAGAAPTLLLIKGSYGVPPQTPEGADAVPAHSWRPVPTGLVASGSAGLSNLRDARVIACGTVASCSGHAGGLAYSGTLSYWITRYLGVEGGYVKPKTMTARGGDSFTFDSELDTDVWTLAALVGVPAGPVRFYGKGGVDYHQATSTTRETIGGASQTFAYETKGYSWTFGGGLEGWVSSRVAIFGEGGISRLKGKAVGGGEALIDDRLRLVLAGLRIHIGG